jgi:TonB family protein
LGELTWSERAVLRASLGDEVPKSLPDRRQPPPDRRRSVTARNFEHIAPGLLTSLTDKVGCVLPAQYEVYTGARIAYQPDGRPQDIGIDASKVTEACGKAVRVMAFLSLAQRNEPVVAGRTVWVFLPHMKSLAACIDEAEAPAVKINPGKNIKRPEKVKHVNPTYPPSAQKDGKQGLVVVEAVISASGCVRTTAVIGSVDLRLDIEALRAVSQWRFTPTLIGSTAVPVIMTVTVNFALQ